MASASLTVSPRVFRIKAGATSPPYRAILRTADGQPVDLSTVETITFLMRARSGATEPVIEAEAGSMQEGDAETGENVGVCEYLWAAGDTDTVGVFRAEFRLDLSDGYSVIVIPNDSYNEIRIIASLAAAA